MCINVIANNLASCLGLPFNDHTQPYHVSWVDATFIPIRDHYLKHIEVQSYKENVLSNVLAMIVGNIIIKHLWLSDYNV